MAIFLRGRVALFLCFWFATVMHIYVPNMGGRGADLPQNSLAWIAMAGMVVLVWDVLPNKKCITLTVVGRLFFIGIFLLFIPQLYTRSEWSVHSFWRLAGLIGGGMFYFTLSQYRMPLSFRQPVLYAILFAVTLQTILALLQLFSPEQVHFWMDYDLGIGRPYGIFQQPNVLGSFIAMGLALSLMLFLLPGFKLIKPRYECLRIWLLATLLVLLPAVLVWIQSRIGWLSGAIAAVLMLLILGGGISRRCVSAALLMVMGTGLALLVLWPEQGIRYISHTSSNHARYTMLRDSLAMIAEKPLLGWGYGGFEYSFQHFRITQSLPTVVTEIARHPHNELLLWWIEGGVVALAGMLVLIAGGTVLLLHAIRATRVNKNGEGFALCLVLLPLLLHTQTEYPFYLSVMHWMVFLLLLAMLERRVMPVMQRRVLPYFPKVWGRRSIQVLALATIVLMISALNGGYALTMAERSGFRLMSKVNTLPTFAVWMHQERQQFAEQMSSLLEFNRTGDEQLLEQYAQWAERYLDKRIDANVYATLLQILYYQEQLVRAEQVRREAALLFPLDERFMVMAINNHKEAP
ncbi:PglL family O-oligosaccharyltransferase [Serratia inhibens]|uniref:PglL family O-oligosaccharyltransferase n=1 Tax=Serratia inhibens TaxID=2338073 RepID=UPI0008097D96|nr:Wzy polymerase domain-containing protein [Serratia inhibens]ANS44712.1 hypothetical protein Q5A_021455 [Serratia inhibens PRI-2C]